MGGEDGVTRWLVTFDDAVHEADTPAEALEKAAELDSTPIGAKVFVIDLDAIEGTNRCIRMRLGGYDGDRVTRALVVVYDNLEADGGRGRRARTRGCRPGGGIGQQRRGPPGRVGAVGSCGRLDGSGVRACPVTPLRCSRSSAACCIGTAGRTWARRLRRSTPHIAYPVNQVCVDCHVLRFNPDAPGRPKRREPKPKFDGGRIHA